MDFYEEKQISQLEISIARELLILDLAKNLAMRSSKWINYPYFTCYEACYKILETIAKKYQYFFLQMIKVAFISFKLSTFRLLYDGI